MKNVFFLFLLTVICSCSNDLESRLDTLGTNIQGREIVKDNVIACAASNEDSEKVSIYFYPRDGATNMQCYSTNTANDDKNNYGNYKLINLPISDVFNGYLMKFDGQFDAEKWVIVTFEESGKIHLSNPIRLKHLSKETEYLPENIEIQTNTQMPIFTWQDGAYTDSKIYFQVVSNSQSNLLSGTYTFAKTFTYYNLNNVVLNITTNTPPELQNETDYVFNLMGVSEDNWVNLFSIKPFALQF
ncbi:hypothetical protein [uncultured Maribacter sp.]|uniref:hypothetical protein n=1 Tax=uncultured Maribacter sp. TaxID=431308 RepID=UPI002610297D|nr:hypothetical protein [uncultured Maribacter sp.]